MAMNRFLYWFTFNVVTYVVVFMVTDMAIVAAFAAVVSAILAGADWDRTNAGGGA